MDITMSEEDRIVHPVRVGDDDPAWGDPAAPVTVVVFSDFECPFCSRHAQNVTDMKKKYGKLVRLVFKQFPLSFHSHAMSAAMASLAAHQQGKFWPMHDQLFDRTGMSDEDRMDWAAKHGIDFDKIVAAVESGKLAKKVQRDIAEGKEMGVQGTPATFVNGVMISGAVSLATLSDAVDLGLARAYVLLNKGVSPEHVYRRLTGQKTIEPK
jgi:protein-disulfide isomerase